MYLFHYPVELSYIISKKCVESSDVRVGWKRWWERGGDNRVSRPMMGVKES
jgi:hypothetical protein